jgi:probable F420-dependent oxidoreductase
LPNAVDRVAPGAILAAAASASECGWDDVWVADHILIDQSLAGRHGTSYEAITTLAFLAGARPDLRVGVAVLVVPQRNAVVLAKQLATLDALSGGRLTVGVGVGWSREEYKNLGAASRFSRRGADLDEAIKLWRHLWSGTSEPFQGALYDLDDFAFAPTPAQGSSLPILVGGSSEAALRRAAALGDGYVSGPLSPAELGERVTRLGSIAAEMGRDTPPVTARLTLSPDEIESTATIRERLSGFLAAGATHLIVSLGVLPEVEYGAAIQNVTEVARSLGWEGPPPPGGD